MPVTFSIMLGQQGIGTMLWRNAAYPRPETASAERRPKSTQSPPQVLVSDDAERTEGGCCVSLDD